MMGILHEMCGIHHIYGAQFIVQQPLFYEDVHHTTSFVWCSPPPYVDLGGGVWDIMQEVCGIC